jgi:hypothetical protein
MQCLVEVFGEDVCRFECCFDRATLHLCFSGSVGDESGVETRSWDEDLCGTLALNIFLWARAASFTNSGRPWTVTRVTLL